MHIFKPFNRLKNCRYGLMLYNYNDMYVGKSLENYGEFSEIECEVFKQLVQPGSTVLDLGANIGTHTILFAKIASTVYAFEPQRIVYQTLCANLALNSIPNVIALNVAVGSKPGKLTFPSLDYNHTNNFGGLSLETGIGDEEVKVITVDSLNLPACHFMKIDVEGMEQSVIEGAAKTIQKFSPILYVENDREQKSAELIKTIDKLDYNMYWHLPPLFNPANFDNNSVNIFSNIVSGNMLCVHRKVEFTVTGMEAVKVA